MPDRAAIGLAAAAEPADMRSTQSAKGLLALSRPRNEAEPDNRVQQLCILEEVIAMTRIRMTCVDEREMRSPGQVFARR